MAVTVVLVLIVGIGVVGLGLRYLPLIDDVRTMRQTAAQLSSNLQGLEPVDLDRSMLDSVGADIRELDERLRPIRGILEDPLVGAMRALPGAGEQVRAAESLVDAADALVEAGNIGLGLGARVVDLREANEADPDFALTPGLVELVATSTDEVDRISGLISTAEAHLAEIPDDAMGQILEARDLVAGPLETYLPMLDSYRELDGVLPELMGWGGEKSYLILAQNPAELRPAGGYAGTVGLITLRDGALVEQRFQDVHVLDAPPDLPFVEPPSELTEYLLAPYDDGSPQPWRLADAAWSPDFPSAAAKAAEFYALETDGAEVDGVIAVTTDALDRLLEVVGPVSVPEYDVVVAPGDVTMTLLGATRPGDDPFAPTSLENRKDVLDVLARTVTERLQALPPDRWADTVEALEDIGDQRMAMVWLADEEMHQLVEDGGWAGPVRQDPGDYVYVVEANVAPTSKFNLVVDRSDALVVELDEYGTAQNRLKLVWQNDAGKKGEPYESLRQFSESEAGWYGAYLRVLVPEGSELISAKGRAIDRIRGLDGTDEEAGRLVFANALLMPPGKSRLSYTWSVPEAAIRDGDGWEYRLVVQKQPGARPFPTSTRVNLPPGAVVTDASEGAEVDGESVQFATDLTEDVELFVRYDVPEAAA